MCGWNDFQVRTTGMFRGPHHRRAARDKYRDLRATLARINAGAHHPHKNHGSVFKNYGNHLPLQHLGYYHEYVHQDPLSWGKLPPGPERIVLGAGFELYYTPDHYNTFYNLTP
jgi:guanyl-specific ribonuclease Sa